MAPLFVCHRAVSHSSVALSVSRKWEIDKDTFCYTATAESVVLLCCLVWREQQGKGKWGGGGTFRLSPFLQSAPLDKYLPYMNIFFSSVKQIVGQMPAFLHCDILLAFPPPLNPYKPHTHPHIHKYACFRRVFSCFCRCLFLSSGFLLKLWCRCRIPLQDFPHFSWSSSMT